MKMYVATYRCSTWLDLPQLASCNCSVTLSQVPKGKHNLTYVM